MKLHIRLLLSALWTCSFSSLPIHLPLHERDFVSISGWAQSGTSLLQQLLTITPGASTMVRRCFEIVGKRCMFFNNEGQWLLKGNKSVPSQLVHNIYGPGRVCTVSENVEQATLVGSYIASQWSRYWDNSSELVVQKSPQDLLKIPFIDSLFESLTRSRKYIVIIKHPATLNVALPKHREWKFVKKMIKSETEQKKEPLSYHQINENFEYFYNMMTRRSSNDTSLSSASTTTSCEEAIGRSIGRIDLGWLPAMDLFQRQIELNKDLESRVRIVRFEEIVLDPLGFCMSLMHFISHSPSVSELVYKARKKLCEKHFSARAITLELSPQPPPDGFNRQSGRSRIGRQHGSSHTHLRRSLRLRNTAPDETGASDVMPQRYKTLDFRRDLAAYSTVSRLQMLKEVVGTVYRGARQKSHDMTSHEFLIRNSILTESNKKMLIDIERRLRVFGYSLLCQEEGSRQYIKQAAYFEQTDKSVLCFLPFLWKK